ncbi:phycobilisome linker polypeptide [Nostoc sp. 'Peltigera membranacea cyanobiont' 232]|uniref:phycobilisome linker polypeptide n=1 Tax=Nostoc sp. 'Peltigera membranacea cyanobiont' 232 TaxID=2014531 RepID=UPI000B953E70|nr:phycobilisome linker polypeptide [Nostoc sp. 'Peltigera membranacea cyanobiont' 232]OYE06863.1 photosystem I reaction center subunit XII [Nostoc sp. 'Peltigera membranacea cyanobiont' 232]
MAFGASSRLGISLFEDTHSTERVPGYSAEELEALITVIYRQVLGNAYVMESERLTVPESQFKRGEISVREFVRLVAKSELYRSRFFSNCPRYRSIELNFRHLLGRAPIDLEEMRSHSTILDEKGFEAEIDSYLDSDEYQDTFGEDIVPYIRGYKTEAFQNIVQFTHIFQLVRGASSSSLKGNLTGKQPRLNSLVIQNTPTPVVSPASNGAIFRNPPLGSRTRHGVAASDEGKVYRLEVTGYRAKAVNQISPFRRSNQVYLVPFNKLSQEYQRIHQQGGAIASITLVN